MLPTANSLGKINFIYWMTSVYKRLFQSHIQIRKKKTCIHFLDLIS